MIVIGGDGTLRTRSRSTRRASPVVGVPKTIDNDIAGTDMTFGFDTAVTIATEALDRIATTAESHNRIMVVEVMGRTKGWIATYAGIAAGADAILVPEVETTSSRSRRRSAPATAAAHLLDRRRRRGLQRRRQARRSAPGSTRSGSSGSAASATRTAPSSSG